MSIVGDTFDYGPFAFLDDYDAGFICNHSDHNGRYTFNQQPGIGHALAHSLSSLLDKDQIKQALSQYEPILIGHYDQLFWEKLGLKQNLDQDQQLVASSLELLQQQQYDYSYSKVRQQVMKRCNPKFILRNYLAQQAIEKANQQDYREVDRLLLLVLMNTQNLRTTPSQRQTGERSCSS